MVAAPGGEFHEGDTVATAMGGMGRNFDGLQVQVGKTFPMSVIVEPHRTMKENKIVVIP